MQARRNSEREPILLQLLAWIPNSMAMAHKVSTDTARTWTRTTTRTPLAPANVGSLPLAPVWHRIQRTTRRATHRIYYFICISYKSHGYVTHMHKTSGSGRCEFLPITDYKRVQTRRLDGVGGLLGPGVWALGTRAIVQRQAQICINFQ